MSTSDNQYLDFQEMKIEARGLARTISQAEVIEGEGGLEVKVVERLADKPKPEMPFSLKEKLIEEYNLIKKKKSRLSRSKRDSIERYVEQVILSEKELQIKKEDLE